MMPLDDGSADGEPDTHAAALRRMEGIKELVHAPTVNANAGIAHYHTHVIAGVLLSADQQLPRPIIDAAHRVCGVAEEIQNDLLELDAIPGDLREVFGELRLNDYAVSLKLTHRQRNYLARGVVQIE